MVFVSLVAGMPDGAVILVVVITILVVLVNLFSGGFTDRRPSRRRGSRRIDLDDF